jgi:K(+)-stimulated pyrophosphate-energized sodium pump
MVEISNLIMMGTRTYMNLQFLMVAVFGGALTVILGYVLGILAAFTFAVGAFLSALSAYISVVIAINANIRTAVAAQTGIRAAFRVSTRNGTIVGMSLSGLALLGISTLLPDLSRPFDPFRPRLRSFVGMSLRESRGRHLHQGS